MSDEDRKFVEALKEQNRQDEENGLAGLGPRAEECLASWKENRPKMYERLRRLGVLEMQASVAENRFVRVSMDLIRGGMPPMDANREASSELMLEPEDDEESCGSGD